jgi:hypothetical protein
VKSKAKSMLIRPGKPKSQFRILLQRFTMQSSPPILVTKQLAVTSRQHITHFLFHQGLFEQKQHDCCPPPTLLFSVFPTEDKTEGCYFYTTEVILAESQAVLNTITEHDTLY